MMKMNRKYSIVAVALIAIMCVGIVYAAFTVTSNTVYVDMKYTVSLTTFSISNSAITLNAAVKNNGVAIGSGINVGFYYSLDGGAWTGFDTKPTDAGGVAQSVFTVTAIGGYAFEARADIP
jgi:hypothetical protein